jgi:AraC family transcriptional regulator
MKVEIVTFPRTRVAVVEHHGPPTLEHETVKKLIAWKIENRFLDPLKHRSYRIHYTDPHVTPPSQHRVDFCLSFDGDVALNSHGILTKIIPELRCARARDIGYRFNNQAALFLNQTWLPQSGESLGKFPMFFHYVNVGPQVRDEEMVTDVYLPLLEKVF